MKFLAQKENFKKTASNYLINVLDIKTFSTLSFGNQKQG